jgi:hypothetical protein
MRAVGATGRTGTVAAALTRPVSSEDWFVARSTGGSLWHEAKARGDAAIAKMGATAYANDLMLKIPLFFEDELA